MNEIKVIICGRDCEDCKYSVIDDSDRAKIKVYCSRKDKSFYYGQCIQCDEKEIICGDQD